MPETSYIIGVLVIVFVITFSLRALPFAALKSLRESDLVRLLSWWMPVGILGILAASTLRTTISSAPSHALVALAAVCTTAVAHLLCRRRTLVSVGVGTLTYVCLVNLF